MKKKALVSYIVALALVANTAAVAFATDNDGGIRLNTSAKADISTGIKLGDHDDRSGENKGSDDRDDDQKNDARMESNLKMKAALGWAFSSAVAGTVTAVNGDTITVKDTRDGSIYMVDTSAAKIRNNNEVSSVSNIVVGQSIVVQGAVNGSSVVATGIVFTKGNFATKPVFANATGAIGTVTKVEGTTITVLSKNGATYTVNASSATFWKNKNDKATISDIKVGDSIIAQGTVSGSTVTAKNVIDIKLNEDNNARTTRGTVTAVSDTTITLLATNGTTYTVNAKDAKFKDGNDKKDNTETISDIKVGESIVVVGDINGTSINAESVVETNTKVGFFHKIGSFFKKIFGGRVEVKN